MKILVVAPHPDDEVLGVGGTILRKVAEGCSVAWLIITKADSTYGWNQQQIQSRQSEILRVKSFLGVHKIYNLDLLAATLDEAPINTLVQKISDVIIDYQPAEIYIPHSGDVHSDHRVVFDATVSASKFFRCKFVSRLLSYETLSETDCGLISTKTFIPNVFVDISDYLENKIQALEIYNSEIGKYPFPRSPEAVKALAMVRGVASGFYAAEAFQLLRERF